jgi:peptidoglycan/xylan/chitin deacetylase (PgdA/CDA1 family)
MNSSIIYKLISYVYSIFDNNKSGVRIFIYHSVDTSFKIDKKGLNNIALSSFESHLELFKNHQVISLEKIKESGFETKIVLTFDDGYSDNLYLAAPLLLKYKIPFTVFVTTNFIQKGNKPFLNPAELIKLSKMSGVTIGSHTVSHPRLTSCSEDQVYFELSESKRYLEDLLNKPIDALSYPYGDVDLRVTKIAQEVGYKIGCCSNFDINKIERDTLLLNRCFVLKDDTSFDLQSKIKGNWDWIKYRYKDPAKIN